MKASMDSGLSGRRKIVYYKDGQRVHLITTDLHLMSVFDGIHGEGVEEVILAGARDLPPDFEHAIRVVRPPVDRTVFELLSQVKGANTLHQEQYNAPLPDGHFISMGSATSRVIVQNGEILNFLVGHAGGGHQLDQLARSMGVTQDLLQRELAGLNDEDHLDMLMEEANPALKGTEYAKLVAVYFGRTNDLARQPRERIALTLQHQAAVDISRDYFIDMREKRALPPNVTFVGGCVCRYPRLRRYLTNYFQGMGINTIMLHDGEFAVAIGALAHAQ